ncbi:Concanavalin A-like lectin/glucanases superfamily protein [uncultured archaeon]|nr:Concanavalin A-like lectin/glucanases superfamily protein [uncultured archaeon]
MRVQARVASDLTNMLGAGARIGQNSTDFDVTAQMRFPFKKEGANLTDMASYGHALQNQNLYSYPFDISFVAPGISGHNATVLYLPGGANVTYGNNGTEDTAVYSISAVPKSISYSISCAKQEATIGTLYDPSGSGETAYSYNATYTNTSGIATGSALTAGEKHDVYYYVDFRDGSNLTVHSRQAPDGGAITVRYTKSPASRLVLPFDENISSETESVRDWSPYGNSFALGGGNRHFLPTFSPKCHAGGCYSFPASDRFLSGPNLNFTDNDVVFSGSEILSNPDFESYSGTPDDDAADGSNDNWDGWRLDASTGYPQEYFDARTIDPPQSGSASVKIYAEKALDTSRDRLYQAPDPSYTMSGQYRFSFFAHGDGPVAAQYRIYDESTGTYLQNDGNWMPDNTPLSTGITGSGWVKVTKEFSIAVDQRPTLDFEFVPSAGGAYWVDNASLTDITGLNGGFEYSNDGKVKNWESGGAELKAETVAPHSGTYEASVRGDPNGYVYNTAVRLKSNTQYTLGFWARSEGDGNPASGVRYAIYDVAHDAYLDGDGNWQNGGQVIFDSTATGKNYQYVSKPFTTMSSEVGEVRLEFFPASDGASIAYIDDVSLSEPKDISVLAWVKTASRPVGGETVLCQYDTYHGGTQGFLFDMADAYGMRLNLYSGESKVQGIVPAVDGKWHQVALVANRSGNYSYYMDGIMQGTGSMADAGMGQLNTTSPFYIGACNGGANSFNGSIDEVRVYARALTPAQVMQHYLGNYQDRCSVDVTLDYDRGLFSGDQEAVYNAYLRVGYSPAEPGLAGRWKFDEGQGTVAHDSSTGNNDAALVGASWLADTARGTSAYFGGATNYSVTPSLALGSQFSVSAWVKANGSQRGYNRIAENSYAGGFYLGTDSRGERYQWAVNNPSYGSVTGGKVADGQWQHVAGTYNGTTGILYVNGVNVSSGAFSAPGPVSLPIYIGSSSASPGSNSWEGAIDDVRVYNYTLTPEEVSLLYRDSHLISSGPVVASRG